MQQAPVCTSKLVIGRALYCGKKHSAHRSSLVGIIFQRFPKSYFIWKIAGVLGCHKIEANTCPYDGNAVD